MATRKEQRQALDCFRAILNRLPEQAPPEMLRVIEFTVRESRELVDVGEEGVALEILLSNLHEVSFPTTPELLAELRWLVGKYAIMPNYAALLEDLGR